MNSKPFKIPNKLEINPKGPTPRYIIIKLSEAKDQVLKAAKAKQLMYMAQLSAKSFQLTA
jgi:hypothetical protein